MTQRQSDQMIADGGIEFQAEYPTVPDIRHLSQALDAIENVSITERDPLYNHVEVEALTQLIRHADEHCCTVGVEFTFGDHVVVVDDSQTIRVHDKDPRIVESSENSEEMR